MPTELLIGICSFFCGFAVMFAVHRVMFDYYDEDAKQEIYDLKCEITALKGDNFELKQKLSNGVNIRVEQVHTFAAPDDVLDLKFNDYLED